MLLNVNIDVPVYWLLHVLHNGYPTGYIVLNMLIENFSIAPLSTSFSNSATTMFDYKGALDMIKSVSFLFL